MALSESFLSTSVEQGLAEDLPEVRAAFRIVFVSSGAQGFEPSACALYSGQVNGDEVFAVERSSPNEVRSGLITYIRFVYSTGVEEPTGSSPQGYDLAFLGHRSRRVSAGMINIQDMC